MWPFKPKTPRVSREEYANAQPPAPCGNQGHHLWLLDGMPCPTCSAIKKREREDLERGLLAAAIVAEMEKRGLVLRTASGVDGQVKGGA